MSSFDTFSSSVLCASRARRERERACVSARAKRTRARSSRARSEDRGRKTHQLLRKVVRNVVVIPVVLPPLRFREILLGFVPLCERKEELFATLVSEFPLLPCPSSFKGRKDRGGGSGGGERGLRSRAARVTYLAFRTPRSRRPPRSSPAPRFACTRPRCPPW